jgi:hypothetical protein
VVGILFSGGTLTRSDLRGFVPRGNHQILGRVVAPPPGSQQVRVAKGVPVIGRETRGGRRVRRPGVTPVDKTRRHFNCPCVGELK